MLQKNNKQNSTFNKNRLIHHCMKEYKWDEKQAFNSVERYEKLFKLFGSGTSLVPTKEIDKVWHLHMLDPISYHDSCMSYHGKLIGHNPSLDPSEKEKRKMDSLFLQTGRIFYETYGEEYSGTVAECDGPDHTCLECSTGGCAGVKNFH
jgi:hypothetical protein